MSRWLKGTFRSLKNAANSVLQLSTEPTMRGRIIAMFLAIALGTTPIGAPIVGWIADRFGARWALAAGAASGFAAAIVGLCYLVKYRRMRVRVNGRSLKVTFDAPGERTSRGGSNRRPADLRLNTALFGQSPLPAYRPRQSPITS